MKITRAELTHFRSYEGCEIVPCEGVNVLLGDNGQGKTNVLEALYLCCTGRSHRTRQDRELIRWGADFASVKVDALRRYVTEHFYTCTPEILMSFAALYGGGGRFTENIDRRGGEGTAAFAARAIEAYCGRGIRE